MHMVEDKCEHKGTVKVGVWFVWSGTVGELRHWIKEQREVINRNAWKLKHFTPSK